MTDARAPSPIRGWGIGFRYSGRSAFAVRDLDLDVAAGECLLVVGPSGSGKSTLARAIGGLVPAEFAGEWEGTLEIGGIDVARAPREAVAARVGTVFQEPASQLVMDRAGDEVAFGLENRAWPLAAMRRRVPEALAEVGLPGMAERRCAALSGGQQQRLALAGALAPRPGVLVLDEPTSNLDPAGALTFLRRLGALVASRSTTVVLVEHRAELAWRLADRVLALDPSGEPIALGAPADVLARHRAALRGAGIWLPDEETAPTCERASGAEAVADGRALAEGRALEFAYPGGPRVLGPVDLAVHPGERMALLGLNGSGKSTLAKLLVGLLRPAAGTAVLSGARPDRLAARDLARLAAYVFQEPELQFLAASVRDEIALGLRESERAAAEALVESLGLPLGRLAGVSPFTLSGGEKRRLSVALALVRHPSLMVLDEPTFGQDRRGFEALSDLVARRVEEGTALVAVSHDLRFVGRVADRAVVLADGRVVHDGPVGALLGDTDALRSHGLAA